MACKLKDSMQDGARVSDLGRLTYINNRLQTLKKKCAQKLKALQWMETAVKSRLCQLGQEDTWDIGLQLPQSLNPWGL